MHACVNVRFLWPPGTRDHTHTQHARGQDGHPHICPHHRDNAGTRKSGQGGHNGRMWCIFLALGATGQGQPEVNIMGRYMRRGRWLMVVKAERRNSPKVWAWTFNIRRYRRDVIADTAIKGGMWGNILIFRKSCQNIYAWCQFFSKALLFHKCQDMVLQ